MLHSIEIIRDPSKGAYSADVVIDLVGIETSLINAKIVIAYRCTGDFVDVPVIRNRELHTVFSCGAVSSGSVIGYGKYTGAPVAALLENKIVIIGRPFHIYLKRPTRLLEELRDVAAANLLLGSECAKKKIMELIIGERKAKRLSRSVQFLELALRSRDTSAIPSFIAEIFYECNVTKEDDVFSVIDQVLSDLYP